MLANVCHNCCVEDPQCKPIYLCHLFTVLVYPKPFSAWTRAFTATTTTKRHAALCQQKAYFQNLLVAQEQVQLNSGYRGCHATHAWLCIPGSWRPSTKALALTSGSDELLLTPQLVQFPGWKVLTCMPPKSVFDGPITNLLSILSILIAILSHVHAKGAKKP